MEELSECCNAEIVVETVEDYPLSINPLSKDYIIQHFDKYFCSKCGEEL